MVSGASARAKGHAFENRVVRLLKAVLPRGVLVRRGEQTKQHIFAQPDVVNPWWWIECKKHRRPSIRAAMRQAAEGAENDSMERPPVAVTQGDRETALVTMPLDAWLALVRAASLPVDGPLVLDLKDLEVRQGTPCPDAPTPEGEPCDPTLLPPGSDV